MSQHSISYPTNDASIKLILDLFLKSSHPSLVVKESNELRFQQAGSSTTITQLSAILHSLSKDCKELLGETDQEKKPSLSWIEKLTTSKDKFENLNLQELDNHLQTRTFMIGNILSAVDVLTYTHLHSHMSSASHQDMLKHPSVTRHFDFIQNMKPIQDSIAKNPSLQLPAVSINVEDVPVPERKAVISEKKDKKAKAPPIDSTQATNTKATQNSSSTKENTNQSEAEKPKTESVKKEKKKTGAGGNGVDSKKAAPVVDGPPMPHMIDMRVGKIINVEKHPDADSLYVEKIDFGEPEPRTVVSGLVNYIPIEEMRDRLLVGICNLKPANMRGIKSFAMVLAATSKEGKGGTGSVELVLPPPGSQPGDRIYFEGFEDQLPIEQLNPKKKQFETIQPNLTTLSTKEACWIDTSKENKSHRIMTSKGVCCAPTFIGASLS